MILAKGLDFIVNNIHPHSVQKVKKVLGALPVYIGIEPENVSLINTFYTGGLSFGQAKILVFPTVGEIMRWGRFKTEMEGRYECHEQESRIAIHDDFENITIELHKEITHYLSASLRSEYDP